MGKVCGDKDGRKAFASRDGQVMVTWATSARKFGRQRYATTYEFNCALESVLSNPCLIPCPLLPLPVLVDFDYYRYLYKRRVTQRRGREEQSAWQVARKADHTYGIVAPLGPVKRREFQQTSINCCEPSAKNSTLPRPRPRLAPLWMTSRCIHARAHTSVSWSCMWLLSILLSSVSSHPPTHTNPSRTARIIASHSGSPPANRWVTHCSSFPTGPGQTLPPAPCDSLRPLPSARGPLSPGPCCSLAPIHPISSFPAHIIHPSINHPVCLARPCFFLSTGPLQQVGFDLALEWSGLDWTGLDWSGQISRHLLAGLPPCDTFLSTHTLCLSPSRFTPRSIFGLLAAACF